MLFKCFEKARDNVKLRLKLIWRSDIIGVTVEYRKSIDDGGGPYWYYIKNQASVRGFCNEITI